MSDPAPIPDVTLERYRLNELSPAETARVERQLTADATLRGRLVALQESDDAIRAELPAFSLAAGVEARLTRRREQRLSPALSVMRWALPLAAVVLLAIVVVRPTAWTPSVATPAVSDVAGDRIKGLEATLAIYRRTDAGSELLADGDRVRAGDLLRIGYKVTGPGYGVILSVDGRGLVTLHLPPDGGRAVRLDSGDTVLLDRAYELDDAPKWERFYLVTGRAAFEVEPVLTALRKTTPTDDAPALSLGPDLGHVTFVLQKDTRP